MMRSRRIKKRKKKVMRNKIAHFNAIWPQDRSYLPARGDLGL